MNTQNFSTKNEYKTKENAHVAGIHIIGLDLGYSAPKCVHENGNFVFPNYCKKIMGEIFGELSKSDLVYADDTDRYCVGAMALASLTEDSVVAEDALFGRNHYLHPHFKVIYRTSLGLALWNVETNGGDVFVQTGLPPAYITKDEPYLRSVIEGHHVFDLTMGQTTKHFDLTISKENVDVMYQPMGTYNSIIFNDNGTPVVNAPSFARAKLLVVDGGFGTFDKFFVNSNQLEQRDTNPNLGMKRILEEARAAIRRDLGAEVSLPAMQACLRTGTVKVMDLATLTANKYDITNYIVDANEMVRGEALDSIKDYVAQGIKYLFITGGTGAAWYPYFKEKLSPVGIEVIPGNANTTLPMIYANARGYYMYRLGVFKYAR